jgi:hypothetical protein
MNAGGNFNITPTSEGKLSGSVVYVSTEGVRSLPAMDFPQIKLKESPLEDFKTVAHGTFFAKSKDPKNDAYGVVTYMGTFRRWLVSTLLSDLFP